MFFQSKFVTKINYQNQSETLLAELAKVQELLDEGDSRQAEKLLVPILRRKIYDADALAQIQLLNSRTLELKAQYRTALEAVRKYESETSRIKLDEETNIRLQVQIAVCCNYLGDAPKAVGLLQNALSDIETFQRNNALSRPEELFGLVYVSLSRVYRLLTEFSISRDFALKGLDYYRAAGDWRGMTQAYLTLANTAGQEGNYEEYIEHCRQILKLIGERPAAYLLGRVYSDMAGAHGFLYQTAQGIKCLEKSIRYYEQTDHRGHAFNAQNNLGWCLIEMGSWERGFEALQKALLLKPDDKPEYEAMTLDSLAVLYLAKGEFQKSFECLEKAVMLAESVGKLWYKLQSLKTLTRFYLETGNPAKALAVAGEMSDLAEKIGDHGSGRFARLLRAEAFLELGKAREFSAELEIVAPEIQENTGELLLLAEFNRLRGLAALRANKPVSAAQYFSRAVSTFEVLKNPYKIAVARFNVGRALTKTAPQTRQRKFRICGRSFSPTRCFTRTRKSRKSSCGSRFIAIRLANRILRAGTTFNDSVNGSRDFARIAVAGTRRGSAPGINGGESLDF